MGTIGLKLSRSEVNIRKDPDSRYRVKRIYAKPGDQVKWKCPNCNIFITFLTNRTPLLNGETEASGRSPVDAKIDPKASGYYVYQAMVQEKEGDLHTVEGNSPPDMVIE